MAEAATNDISSAVSAPVDPWTHVAGLVCNLSVEVPLPEFRVADVLALAKQSVVDTHWQIGNDVPLRVNGELLAWCEFEIVGTHLAVRLTELA